MDRLLQVIETTSEKRFLLYSLIFFLLLSTIVRISTFFFDFFSNDEAAHFIGSLIIKNGMILYSDFVDNKPPFIYLFYLLSQIIFGENMLAVHLMTTILVIPLIAFFSMMLIYKMSRIAGFITGFFVIIFTSSYIPTDMLATNCEIIMLLFASIGFIFLQSDKNPALLLFGISIGLATLSKQHAAIWIILPFISRSLKKDFRGTPDLLLPIAGFLIPILASLLYFFTNNNLDKFIYFTVSHNIGYSQNPLLFTEILIRFAKYLLPYLIIISPLIYFYLKGRKNVTSDFRFIFEPALILSIIMIFIGFRFFPHYFIQSIYPLSILAATYFIGPNKKIKSIVFIIIYSFLLSISFNIYTFANYSKKTDFIEETEPLFREIPRLLKENGLCNGENRRLFVWGYAPLFYYYFYKECSMLPASRFVLPQASTAGYIPGNESQFTLSNFESAKYIIEEHRRQLLDDLKRNYPSIIIDTSKNNFHNWGRYTLNTFPELKEFINSHYSLYKNINGFEIYIKSTDHSTKQEVRDSK
ncbi:MAG: ArnT family glycosyltransferase [Myxococcota bacterium]